MRIVVGHGLYGCETGCCGHWIEVDGQQRAFRFGHPAAKEQLLQWAQRVVKEEFGAEHVADLDWEHCVLVDEGSCLAWMQ